MTLENVYTLAIQGIADNRMENVQIPTDMPIRELRFSLDDAACDSDAGLDPFNEVFEYIELTFDGQSQYKIENIADLYNIVIAYTGLPPTVVKKVDTDTAGTGGDDVLQLMFRVPVLWTPGIGVIDPRIKLKFAAAAGTNLFSGLDIKYVQTQDTRNWVRFKYIKDEKEVSSASVTHTFRPDVGATVRGAFIRIIDNSVTDIFNTAQKYALEYLSGGLGFAEITLRHNGISYFDKATERDILYHQQQIFTKLDFPHFWDAGYTAQIGMGRLSGFFFEGLEAAAVTGASVLSLPMGWLYISFEDLVSNANTYLRLKGNAGSFASGDQMSVIWVYKQLPPSDVKSV